MSVIVVLAAAGLPTFGIGVDGLAWDQQVARQVVAGDLDL